MKLRYSMLAIISCAAIALTGYCVHLNQKLVESENRIHQLQVENEEVKRKLMNQELAQAEFASWFSSILKGVDPKGPSPWGDVGRYQPNEPDKK